MLSCLNIQTLVFKRGNLVGDEHPQPAVAEAKLRLDCSFPHSIVVLADEPGLFPLLPSNLYSNSCQLMMVNVYSTMAEDN